MSDRPGSILGGILLTAGSCIGAGMLGLPILTGIAGFFPALLMFFIAWLFMTTTGLLLVEVNGWFSTQVNIVSMMGRTLGKFGRIASWVLYLFLFYSLLVAYISGSGNLLVSFLPFKIPIWIGSLFFVLLFGYVVFSGTRQVDLWNRVMMFIKIAAFIGIIVLGIGMIQPGMLLRSDLSYMLLALPILVVSFGFHNMIPSLTAYMKGDLKRVKKTILGGSILTLVIYLIWEILILGIVPLEGDHGIIKSLQNDKEASQALAGTLGLSWVSGFGQAFGFFAILTSFLAQSLSLVHFLADAINVDYKKKEPLSLCALALLPPLILSLIYPQLFFKALSFAGGWAAILFGIFPVCMVWIGRYRKHIPSTYKVFGGKPLLILIMLFSLFIVFYQISVMVGASYVPKVPNV